MQQLGMASILHPTMWEKEEVEVVQHILIHDDRLHSPSNFGNVQLTVTYYLTLCLLFS